MISPKYIELIKRLSSKTGQKQLIWQRSSGDNEFKLQMTTGTLTLNKYDGDYNYRPSVTINIYNNKGEKVDIIEVEDSVPEFNLLDELYGAVRRSYYRVDETIEGFFDELGTDKIIGAESAEEEDDDLPF